MIENLLWALGGFAIAFVVGYLLLVKFFIDMWR